MEQADTRLQPGAILQSPGAVLLSNTPQALRECLTTPAAALLARGGLGGLPTPGSLNYLESTHRLSTAAPPGHLLDPRPLGNHHQCSRHLASVCS